MTPIVRNLFVLLFFFHSFNLPVLYNTQLAILPGDLNYIVISSLNNFAVRQIQINLYFPLFRSLYHVQNLRFFHACSARTKNQRFSGLPGIRPPRSGRNTILTASSRIVFLPLRALLIAFAHCITNPVPAKA